MGGVEELEPVMAPASELPALELRVLVTKEDRCEWGPVVWKGTLLEGLRLPLRSPPVDEAEMLVEFVAETGLAGEEERGRLETAVPP